MVGFWIILFSCHLIPRKHWIKFRVDFATAWSDAPSTSSPSESRSNHPEFARCPAHGTKPETELRDEILKCSDNAYFSGKPLYIN
jgi:hypothetical protein